MTPNFFRLAGHVWLLICMISMHPAHAQKANLLDSLSTLLKTTPEGENKLDLYEKIFAYYTDVKPDLVLAKTYADSLNQLALKLKNGPWQHEAEFCYGIIAFNQNKVAEASQHLTDYVVYNQSQGDSTKVAKGLYYIAVMNINLGNYEKSLAVFYRILAIVEKADNPKKIATTLNGIAGVYKGLHREEDAIKTYKRTAKIFQSLGLKLDYAISIQNIGNSLLALKRYDSAKWCYEESLKVFNEFNHQPFIGTTLGNLGNLYQELNDYSKALQLHQQALLIWRQSTRKRSLANCLDNIGICYLNLKKYNEAKRNLEEALQLAQEVKARPLILDIYTNISAVYLETNNYEKAYRYHLLMGQLKDSIYNEDNARQINELQAKYETEKKDKQILMLAKEKDLQEKEAQHQATVNKALAGGLVLTLIVAGLAYYIFRQRSQLTAKNIEVKESDFKRQLTELEMKALRAQINPHFLFNCMNAINLMIRKGETENACLYVTKFSKLVRLILENSEASSVTLENEIELLESYMTLEELRAPGKISHAITVDESIGIQQSYLPSMVLQPFVENAIWHGLIHKEQESKGIVSIDIRKDGDMLCCTIEDDGVGREKAKQLRDTSLMQRKSMGIKITEDRLRLLSSSKRDRFITITDLKDGNDRPVGTRVKVYIPTFE